VSFACNGDCPKDRFLHTPNGDPGLHYLCKGYRVFFNHIDPPYALWPSSTTARRAEAEVMELVAKKKLPGYKPRK